MNPATVQYRNNLKLIQNETKKLGVESRNAFKQAQDAISDTTAKTGSLGLAFRTLGQFFMIGSPIMVISKTFKELVSTVNEANKSLTDIQMVTGMSTDEANKLALTYNELGQQIGATTQEILTGSVEWFRAGKTIDKLFVLDGCQDGPVRTIIREAKKHDTIINFVTKERLDQISTTGGKHQGVIKDR